MSSPKNPTSEETIAVWENIARWWDNQIGEGNDFQKLLIMPATDRLLQPVTGQIILDIACGNGNYSRRLGSTGATVIACDACAAFLDCARQRTTTEHGQIEYRQIDATDTEQLLRLGLQRFDSAVCSMAMMDIPTISPLIAALAKLLKPAGRFVFSLPHPCFNSTPTSLTAEMVGENGKLRQIFGVNIREYLSPMLEMSSGIINQPQPHYFFHRPLSAIFSELFAAGFVMDGFEEPAFPPDAPSKNAFSWAKRPGIPPVAVIRARLAARSV